MKIRMKIQMKTVMKTHMKPLMQQCAAAVMCACLLTPPAAAEDAAEVNVYSYRSPQLIRPMLDAFTAGSGIRVNAVFAKKGMLERLRSEGANSPADLVFTVDIGRLSDIKNAGLTQAVQSRRLRAAIPANARDPDNHWFGLTARARMIVTSRARVAPGAITRYEDLADARWKGKVCTRSGKHAYNVALFASMMQRHGDAGAMRWLRGLKANLARRPQGNDRAQAKAVAEGVCDVAIINHYYLHAMRQDPKQRAWVDALNAIFPNQQDRGAHMNISGMAMSKHAPNRANALRLMEFLAGDLAQRMYAEVNGEYPVNPRIKAAAAVRALGAFKRDTLALAEIAARRADASKLADIVGYND
ncbi:MAG: Fe(3+) ABC transporter substrate-binding protein [Gammaproteobacteria bacterium]